MTSLVVKRTMRVTGEPLPRRADSTTRPDNVTVPVNPFCARLLGRVTRRSDQMPPDSELDGTGRLTGSPPTSPERGKTPPASKGGLAHKAGGHWERN